LSVLYNPDEPIENPSYTLPMKLHIMKASGRLNPFEAELRLAFNEVLEKVNSKLQLPEIDVVMVDYPDTVIPETGVVGYAITKNLLYVYVDPDSIHFKTHAHEEIVSTLTHELHHCARMSTVGYGKTLLEAIVSEGLADHFDIEINHHEPKPWSISIQDSGLEKVFSKAALEFDNANYNHAAWFFGSEEKGIPRWSGYSLGFKLVRDYMKKTAKSASELAATPAELFTA
jgi:uncharacterized protein YjaZ